MRMKRYGTAVWAGSILAALVCGSAGQRVFAGQDGLLTAGRADGKSVVMTYGEDGVVDGKREFVISSETGKNYDVTITFTGNGAPGVLSFSYDRVTDDQMVPNTDKSADDRSGLLNEAVKEGQEQTRSFQVAATAQNIVITASGNGKVTRIEAVRQEDKTAGEKTFVYTIGDSLVQTYAEKYAPQTGWGQTLSLYFDESVVFVNRALGGRSTGNYLRQGRLNEVLCEIAPGDYCLIEFGHNDATRGNADRYVTIQDFKKNLAEQYIQPIRDRGATPILVTLCNRNQVNRSTGECSVSFPEYVKAMRETAAETDTLLIDLNAITVEYFTKLSQELGAGVTDGIIFNHAIAGAFEGEYAKGVKDNTHLQYYGAKMVGGFVAGEMEKLNLSGVSEHYTPLAVVPAPGKPEGIAERKYEGFVSRITWTPCEGADYYKVLVAEVVKHGSGADGNDGGGSGTDAGDSGTADPAGSEEEAAYDLAGEFQVAGYTAVCDFAYSGAKEGQYYAYKVVAVNGSGESPESDIFSFGLLREQEEQQDLGQPGEQEGEEPFSGTMFNPAAVIIIGLGVAVAVLVFVVIKKKNKTTSVR